MAKVQFNIAYTEDCTKTNNIILKVQSYGGTTYYGGRNIFKIECDRSVKKKLEREIQDMLKT